MNLLRTLLIALVLLNLAFVLITGAADPSWLVPLALLTVAAPILQRGAERALYKIAWNVAVLTVFGVLVHDAMTAGIRFLLEDGLLLAAFCQVHLLNTLGKNQRPDLLFFNSFLIALVTGFFCQDFVYCQVFAGYAFVLLAALQVAALERASTGQPRALRPLLGDAAGKAAVALGLTLLAFLFVPRDFHREGLLGDHLLLGGGAMHEVGFQEDVPLGRIGPTVVSEEVVLRIQLLEGEREAVPSHLRGATCALFDEQGWHASGALHRRGRGSERQWVSAEDGFRRSNEPALARVRVDLLDATSRLFVPLAATAVQPQPPADEGRLVPLHDGSFLVGGSVIRPDRPLRYDLELGGPHHRGGPPRPVLTPQLQAYVQLHAPSVVDLMRQRLRDWPSASRAGRQQHEVVEELRERLATTFRYLPPGMSGAARDLREFLAGKAGGHCEYFATTLALLLRLKQIPCRLATGYLATEWDEQGVLVVRSKHAHAWVEVNDPTAGWYTVDPTPVGTDLPGDRSLWQQLGDEVAALWKSIAGFDADARRRLLQQLPQLPGRFVAWCGRHPLAALGVLALLCAWLLLRTRQRRRLPAAVRAYLAAVRRAGLLRAPNETPRELLQRASASAQQSRVARLDFATATHELERYRT